MQDLCLEKQTSTHSPQNHGIKALIFSTYDIHEEKRRGKTPNNDQMLYDSAHKSCRPSTSQLQKKRDHSSSKKNKDQAHLTRNRKRQRVTQSKLLNRKKRKLNRKVNKSRPDYLVQLVKQTKRSGLLLTLLS